MYRNMHCTLTRAVENLHKINTRFLYMHALPIFFTFGILMSKEGLKRKGIIMGYTIFPFFSLFHFLYMQGSNMRKKRHDRVS